MKKLKAIIRADGNSAIGMGHIMRTSVLADTLSKEIEITYVMAKADCNVIKLLKAKGYHVLVSKEEDIFKIFEEIKADLIITDSYNIGIEYVKSIRKIFPYVVYISDDDHLELEADLIINQNFKADVLKYETSTGCDKLLGSRFVMLREEFRQSCPISIKDEVKNIFISVGGGDPNNWMKDILDKIKEEPYIYHAIIGPSFIHQAALIQYFANEKNIIFYQGANMCEVMKVCDLAISTCGSTLYELGSLGIPTIGVSVADNQIPIARNMEGSGNILYLGDLRMGLEQDLKEAIHYLNASKARRIEMQRLSLQHIDCQGVIKIRQHIMDKLYAKDNERIKR